MWNHRKRIWASLRHNAEVNGRRVFESELAAGREELKTRVEHQPRKCKDRRKLRLPFWGGLQKEVPHQTRTCEDETSKQTR